MRFNFNFTLISSFLLASAVLADRYRHHRRSPFLNLLERSTDAASKETYYSPTTAGALIVENGMVTYVTGEFTVPHLEGPNDSGATVIIGIDVGSCVKNTSLLFTVAGIIKGNEHVYQAAGGFFPDNNAIFPGISISAGNVLKLSIEMPSKTSGHLTIENISTGKSEEKVFDSKDELCSGNLKGNVAWSVEKQDGPLANFGEVEFTHAHATGPNGMLTPSDGAHTLDIKEKGKVLTKTSVDGSSITVKYV